VRRLAIAAIALLTLTGCGSYALAFTPTGDLPDYADTVGTWAHDEATLTLADDRSFAVEGLPDGLTRLSGDFGGTVEDAPARPSGSMASYDLYDESGVFIATLYYYDGMLEDPVFLFAQGVVDDGDWFRFAKQPEASR
jgi:hypothetical protein